MQKRFTTTLVGRPVGWFETLEDDGTLSSIVGTPGDDKLHGGKGDDSIDGLAGADTMAGRLGNDTFYVDNAGDVVKERLDEGIDTVVSDIDWVLGQNLENLTLRGGIERLKGSGNDLGNVIIGNAGENVLDGRAGDDLIKSGGTVGPFQSDTLIGGKGDDTLLGGAGYLTADLLQGGAGNDTLQVASGANTLDGGAGNDLLQGGSGNGQHFPAYDTLIGGAGRDTLEGGSWLDGGDGNDSLDCSLGISASGGAGNDTISGTGGAGYNDFNVNGEAGHDKIDVYSVNNDLFAYGGDGNDTIDGGATINTVIDGGLGDDVINGHKSTPGGMTLTGGEGNDTITGYGYGNAYSLAGGDGDDWLRAVAGPGTWASVELSGDAGNDTLSASHGMATFTGGEGEDRFLLSVREVLGQDMVAITDFESGCDRLSLSQSSLPVGDGDLLVDGAVTVNGPGGFDANAELVIVAADIFGDLTLDKAAAAIGSANQDYAAGQTVVFMVDNGVDSWALYFQSNGADAQVSAAELGLLARLNGTASTGAEDVVWGA